MVLLDKRRFIATMQEQATIGCTDRENELDRLAPSEEIKGIYDWFVAQLELEGLDVRIDEIGNIFGRREGNQPELEPLLIGSHLDSHHRGGIFDGALGVISALEFIRTLNEEEIQTRRPIEVVSWFNEEAGRYDPGLMGSRVWAGLMDLEAAYSQTDADGVVLEEALDRIGYKGETPAEPTEDYEAYLELHIEQGPNLKENDKDVGIVTGIIGMTYGVITFKGETDHAGGTQMHQRHDAVVAAADIISQVQRTANSLGERTVGTVGHLDLSPNNRNAVPGTATLSWEFRDPSDEIVEDAYRRILEEIECAAEREGVAWSTEERARAESVRFDNSCRETIAEAADSLGYDGMHIFSGGGHDAQIVQHICDAGMVFAVNDSGKSHTANEYTSWKNCYKAANTLANAAISIAGQSE